MIDWLIKFALNQRAITVLFLLFLIGVGTWSLFELPVDSFPDVSNVQVQIITEPESMATEEVESLVTVPIEYALNGLPYIQKVRSTSEFGLSVVTAIFDDSCDVYFARQLVQQRLNTLTFPPDVPKPQLGPVVSSFSQVFIYQISSDKHNFIDLRTIQDWHVSKKLLSVQGVANVVTYGGWIKQYQVFVDQDKLRSYDLTLKEVLDAISRSNRNVGGSFIEDASEEVIIRGVGMVKSTDEIGQIVLKEHKGTPVLVNQVAEVKIGPALRRGSASMNGKGEAITGTVMTRKGVNTREVVEKVEERLKEIEKDLPEGIKLTPLYNQKELVDKTMDTVKEILFFSGGLVVVILAAILLDIPTALIVTVVIPLSLLFSFFMMKVTGLSANLMTLGAVDFGVVIDAGVVVVENVYRRLANADEDAPLDRLALIMDATREVGRPVCFAIIIIMAVYLPLFTLEGIEGKMFIPLALTFVYALLGALVVSLTAIPLMCYWCLRGKVKEHHNPVVEWIKDKYDVALRHAVHRPKAVIAVSLALLAGALPVFFLLGSEFMPNLDEGPVLLRLRMPLSISHTKSREYCTLVENLLMEFPEVKTVATRIGRSGMGSDVEGVDSADMYIGLAPKSQWKDRNKEHLVNRMAERVSKLPGVMYSFSQPIADMVDDLVTGIKADVGIKISGDDLHTLDSLAEQIRAAVSRVQGSADVSREPIIGEPELNIRLNREALARHGLVTGDVQDLIEAAVAGKSVTEVIEGSKRFSIMVRLAKEERSTAAAIGNILVDTPNGSRLPLRSLAHLEVERGALMVTREDGQRRSAVMVNIRGRDLGSWVGAAQKAVAESVQLPKGYKIIWGGQFENQQRAMTRLAIVVPLVLFLILVLLFFTFNSLKNAALIMLNVPFATIGGIVALWVSHQPLSVPAMIGFIAVFGVAVQNGVILTSYVMLLEKQGAATLDAIRQGALVRLRPILMTATVAMMGLLPKLISDGTGAEIQRPLATVVFGGLLSSTATTLFVLPTVYRLINSPKRKEGPPPTNPLDNLVIQVTRILKPSRTSPD